MGGGGEWSTPFRCPSRSWTLRSLTGNKLTDVRLVSTVGANSPNKNYEYNKQLRQFYILRDFETPEDGNEQAAGVVITPPSPLYANARSGPQSPEYPTSVKFGCSSNATWSYSSHSSCFGSLRLQERIRLTFTGGVSGVEIHHPCISWRSDVRWHHQKVPGVVTLSFLFVLFIIIFGWLGSRRRYHPRVIDLFPVRIHLLTHCGSIIPPVVSLSAAIYLSTPKV